MQEYCFCVSYVKLNQRLLGDILPAPNVWAVLDELHRGRYYSVIDMRVGFHNVPVHWDSHKFLGFVTEDGVYVWKRMPMGISTAPGHFQQCMVRVLKDQYGRIVAVYIDDLIIFGDKWEECWHHTVTMLRVITQAGLAVNVGKATLCQTRAKVLGHIVDGVR